MTVCSHLAKRVTARALSSSCAFYSYSSPPWYQNLALLTPLLRSPLSTQTQTQPQAQKELPFIAQYLIYSFGFSPNRALKCSADSHLAPIKSPERPEAVVKFLSDTGLTDAQIKAVVTFQPNILCGNVDKTFKPKVRELINEGCSGELLVQLICHNPHVLYLNSTLSRLLFWRDFIGNDDQALVRIIKQNSLLLTHPIDKHILPRIHLLNEYGMSNRDIMLLLREGTRCISKNLDSLRATLDLIEEMGILRGSTKFCNALKAVGGIREDLIKMKIKFFKEMCGWSHEEISAVFRGFPKIFALSEENLKSKMNFLIRKAQIEASSIATYPAIFTYNLERVLIARYNVLSALKAKGLKIKRSYLGACHMSEKPFSESYVLPFEKDVPGLCQAYMASRGLKGQD